MNKNRILRPVFYALCCLLFSLASLRPAHAQITIAIEDLIGKYVPSHTGMAPGHPQPEAPAAIVHVSVVNSQQQVVYTQAIPALAYVTLPSLPAGIYTVQIMTTHGLYTLQINSANPSF